ncbi:MBL fold metallo-hydrolase [Streptomyces sp. M19]
MILTDAELDHTLGIARLREADRVAVHATAPVRRALLDGPRLGEVLGPYATLDWYDLGPRPEPLGPGAELAVAALPSPPSAPLRRRNRLRRRTLGGGPAADGTGHRALRAVRPALAAWPETLQEAAAVADCVIVDGTFWDEEEPRAAGFSSRTATGMGHLPIDGPGGTARILAELPGRRLYTHLNNTNPWSTRPLPSTGGSPRWASRWPPTGW